MRTKKRVRATNEQKKNKQWLSGCRETVSDSFGLMSDRFKLFSDHFGLFQMVTANFILSDSDVCLWTNCLRLWVTAYLIECRTNDMAISLWTPLDPLCPSLRRPSLGAFWNKCAHISPTALQSTLHPLLPF